MKKDTFLKRWTTKFESISLALAALIWAPVVRAAEAYSGISVTPASGDSSIGYLFVGGVLLVIAVGVYLKLKKPATFDRLTGQAQKAVDQVEHVFAKAPDGTTAAAPAPDAALQAELARLRADAAARAKADADALIAAAQTKAPAPPPALTPPPAPPPAAPDQQSVIANLTEALRLATSTNHMNAGVVLSPPVQAVINGAPAAAPLAPSAPPAPAGNTSGDFIYSPTLQGTPGYAAGSIEGEAAIQRWMAGEEMEPGLKAAVLNSTFVLGRLTGSQINAYLAGGGVGYLPLSPQAYGWRWSNNTWLQPVNDTGGLTWDGKFFHLIDISKVHFPAYK